MAADDCAADHSAPVSPMPSTSASTCLMTRSGSSHCMSCAGAAGGASSGLPSTLPSSNFSEGCSEGDVEGDIEGEAQELLEPAAPLTPPPPPPDAPSPPSASDSLSPPPQLGAEVGAAAAGCTDEVDAWSLDNWDSPGTAGPASSSPATPAASDDDRARELSSLVRMEVQEEMQALAHSSSTQLQSWLSEEIAFARRCLEEELRAAVADRVSVGQLEELRTDLASEFRAELREVKAAVDAEMIELRSHMSGQVDTCQRELRLLGSPGGAGAAEPSTSSAVAEARALAEERRRRLQLDAWEQGIERQRAGVEALERRADELAGRLTLHDAEFRRATAAVQRLESSTVDIQKDVRVLQASAERQGAAAQDAEGRQQGAERRAAALEAELMRCTALVSKVDGDVATWRVEQRRVLDGQGPRLAAVEQRLEVLAAARAEEQGRWEQGFQQIEELQGQVAAAKAQVAVAEKERLAELRVVCSKLETQGVAVDALSKTVGAMPQDFQEQLACLEEGCRRAVGDVSRVVSAELQGKASKDEVSACDGRVTELAEQLSELVAGEKRIAKQTADLARLAAALDGRDARFESLREEMKRGLADKAKATELQETAHALHTWMEEVRESLGSWSQQAQQSTSTELQAAKTMLRQHASMLANIWGWCKQVRVREQGLTHLILHMVENGSHEQTKLLEEALNMPRLPLED